MHNGLKLPSYLVPVDEETFKMEGGSKIIEVLLGEMVTNKMLVLTGKNIHGQWIACYSYDNRRFGVFVLEERG